MATAHFSHFASGSPRHHLDGQPDSIIHHEKISCSFGDQQPLNPPDLLGRHVILEEYLPATLTSPGEVITFGCTVVGLIFGVPSMSVPSQLVYCPDGHSYQDMARLSRLTVTAID